MTDTFKTTVRPGLVSAWKPSNPDALVDVFVTIELREDGELSITAVEGPKSNGDAWGSSGQARALDVRQLAPGWTAEMVAELRAVWERWHLNHLCAGSPSQSAWLRENPVKAVYPESHYEKAKAALAEAGLEPDAGHMHKGKPYSYGTAWLREEVPADVIAWLRALPAADKPSPWARYD